MQRLPVDSSDILSIGYDAKTRTLEVEFHQQRIYRYLDVAPDVHDRFLRAESFGDFFDSHIKRHYRFVKVNEQKAAAYDSLAFVSGNADKLRDLQAACAPFDIQVERLDLPVEEIQSHDPDRVITHKVKQAYKLAGRPVVVQDTFWNILALRGFPGPYMRYISEWLKPEDFLALMQGKADRTVIRTHHVAYYDGKHLKKFAKDFAGTIIEEARGAGVAIDQIVITAGETRTNAEIREAEGRSSILPEASAWYDFAKWYNMRRRIAKMSVGGDHERE